MLAADRGLIVQSIPKGYIDARDVANSNPTAHPSRIRTIATTSRRMRYASGGVDFLASATLDIGSRPAGRGGLLGRAAASKSAEGTNGSVTESNEILGISL